MVVSYQPVINCFYLLFFLHMTILTFTASIQQLSELAFYEVPGRLLLDGVDVDKLL